jgi:bacteriocin-like protein
MSSINAEPKPSYCELNEEDLDNVSGGSKSDYLLQIEGIKGESQDTVHVNEIHL